MAGDHVLTKQWQRFLREEEDALPELLDALIPKLKPLASRFLRRHRQGADLQTTALVDDAVIHLLAAPPRDSTTSRELIAGLATFMRCRANDSRRRSKAVKRGAGRVVHLEQDVMAESVLDPDAISDLTQALIELRVKHPEEYLVTAMKYFWGLNSSELAEHLGVSRKTITRRSKFALSFLKGQLS